MPKPVRREKRSSSLQAISTRLPEIIVEYDCNGQRLAKHFKNAYQARTFYTKQFELDNHPSLMRSDGMTTQEKTTTTTKTRKSSVKKSTKKTPDKKSTKKTPAKKAAKKSTTKKTPKETTKKEPKSKDGVRNSVIEKVKPTLEFLLKNPEATKKAIREGTKLKYLGIPWLQKNNYIKTEDLEQHRGLSFSITPEGKKFLDSLK